VNQANRSNVSSSPLPFAGPLVICLIPVSLSVGFLTPFLSAIPFVAAAANLLTGFNLDNSIYLFLLFNAAALALHGLGVYSLDARVFGRRVIPSYKDTSRH
jgi:hypothetical protein